MASDGCIYDKFTYGFFSQGGGSLPSFIAVDESTLLMNISTGNNGYMGDYSLELTGSLNPNLMETFSFVLRLLPYLNTGPPKFIGMLKSPLTAIIGSSTSYALPTIKDPDGDQFDVRVSYLGSTTLPTFMFFDQASQKL